MRKSLYSLAVATVLSSAISASAYTYTVTPASGSTVSELTKVNVLVPEIEYFAFDYQMDASKVVVTKDGETVSTCQFRDANPWNSVDIELNTPISTAGTYTLHIPAGVLCYADDEGYEVSLGNPDLDLTYTVVPKEGVTYDVEPTSVSPEDGAEKAFNEVTLNFVFASEYDLVEGAHAVLASAIDGYEYSKDIKLTNFYGTIIGRFTDLDEIERPTRDGAYTITIPKGTIGSASFLASGNTGYANDELVYHYTFTGLTKDNSSTTPVEFSVESVLFNDGSGFGDSSLSAQWAEETAKIPDGSKFTFKTSNNLAVGYISAVLTDNNPSDPDEAIVRRFESHARRLLAENIGVYWQDDEDPFLEVYGDIELIKDHTYTLSVEFYDFENPKTDRTQLGTCSRDFDGLTEAFKYSDVTVESITPDQKTTTINSVFDGYFLVQCSDYVNVNVEKTVFPRYGTDGIAISSDYIEYTDDHKSFVFTFPESELLASTAQIEVNLYLEDANGLPLLGEIGVKEDTHFHIAYACYLGSPDLTVSPADNSEVEQIKDIYISCPDGPANGMINPSYVTADKIQIINRAADRVYAEFTADPETVATGTNSDGEFPTMLKFSLDEAITEPGLYVVKIPAAYFALGSEYDHATSKEQYITYTIEGSRSDNVTYDFLPTATAVTIDRDDNDAISCVEVLCRFAEEVAVSENINNCYVKDANGNTVDARIENTFDWNDFNIWTILVYSSAIENNQTYTLVVPKAVFGDLAWGGDDAMYQYTEGHANDEFNVAIDTQFSGVENVAVNAADLNAPVYNLQGVQVKANASSLKQLPAGIYIVGGRKVVVK
jgi:hypothetical protein